MPTVGPTGVSWLAMTALHFEPRWADLPSPEDVAPPSIGSSSDPLASVFTRVGNGATLGRGDLDQAAVKELQEALNRAGAHIKVDGRFGPETEAAVRQFQRKAGLKPDGKVGRCTLGALRTGISDDFRRTKESRLPMPAPRVGSQTGIPPSQPHRVGSHPLLNRRISNAFMRRLAPMAVTSEMRTGVPAEVTLAQAALESGWGKSKLASRHENFFDIRAHGEEGSAGSVEYPVTQIINGRRVRMQAKFRAYLTPEHGFVDHGKALRQNPRYEPAFQHRHDPIRFARSLQKAGYSKDPAYAQKLISIMRKTDLVD